jgi:hypothetical protein
MTIAICIAAEPPTPENEPSIRDQLSPGWMPGLRRFETADSEGQPQLLQLVQERKTAR